MIKNIFLILSICLSSTIQAQDFLDDAENSLVKVMVAKDKNAGVCSGFLWGDASTIVTTLHSMKPNGTIEIFYQGGIVRSAEIAGIYEDADLVLLKLKSNQHLPPTSAEPLKSYQPDIRFNEEIFALGYNGGSLGNQTQTLKKGRANPENLRYLVRDEDLANIKKVDIPDDLFPIYFLQGSLLPGFSGSPIFNAKGELVGIGDGGLEKGQMNVSWAIPAKNIDVLVNSTNTTLPDNLVKLASHYSAEVNIEIKAEVGELDPNSATNQNSTARVFQEIEQTAANMYSVYKVGDYQFFQTKTRGWRAMKRTSLYPESMDKLEQDFASFKIDTSFVYYDLFEDPERGYTIALPEWGELEYEDETEVIFVNLDSTMVDADLCALMYYETQDFSDDPLNDLIKQIIEWDDDLSTLEIIDDYTDGIQLDEEYSMRYGFFASDVYLLKDEEGIPYQDDDGNNFYEQAYIYMSVLYNEDYAFYSIAESYMPVNEEMERAFQNGVNCADNASYDNNFNTCNFFESMMTVIGSAHLTTLSYINWILEE